MSRDAATVADILAAAARIERFLAGTHAGELSRRREDEERRSPRAARDRRSLQEALAAFRDANPSIPWRQMAGMRDKLIHAYDAVDVEEVWRTATVDVPEVAATLRPRTSG